MQLPEYNDKCDDLRYGLNVSHALKDTTLIVQHWNLMITQKKLTLFAISGFKLKLQLIFYFLVIKLFNPIIFF